MISRPVPPAVSAGVLAAAATPRVAYFISPHGFGHASRASAVMAAVARLIPEIHFDLFTTVPEWFFQRSIAGHFTYHSLQTDVGLAQLSPFESDLPQTLSRLDRFLPFRPADLEDLAIRLRARRCTLVICDIAPLGIEAAHQAGLPSMLIENFTWDWLYTPYVDRFPGLGRHRDYLARIFERATHHIQTEPVCSPHKRALKVPPVSRQPQRDPQTIRDQLHLDRDTALVMVSLGGVPVRFKSFSDAKLDARVTWLLPGDYDRTKRSRSRILLPINSAFYHPDLILAADAVVGKVGYSTLAEIYACGKAFGYIARTDFRESPILADFIQNRMSGLPIDQPRFESGQWLDTVEQLLALPTQAPPNENGAERIATYVAALL